MRVLGVNAIFHDPSAALVVDGREDADLARQIRDDGWRLVRGERHIIHPVRPADFWVSVRVQRGNGDDALLRAVHGRRWRQRTQCPPGRFPQAWPEPVRAVLFDRDGTLVHDVPYNGDPAKVSPVDDAAKAVERLRSAGLRVGVVTNQSAIGRGLATAAQVSAVNDQIDRLIGPFDTWQVCPHTAEDRCGCRKPADGLIRSAARSLGVSPQQIVVIGDIGADMVAADAAGARSILVPNHRTRPEEVLAARVTAPDLQTAVDHVLKRLR